MMIRSLCTSLSRPLMSFRNVRCDTQLCFARNLMDDRRPQEKGLNQVILMGRCGTEPQLRGTETTPVVIFSLATHSHYKPSDSTEFTQKTEWHRISIFKPRLLQKTLDYAKKGTRLYVQGRLSYGEITDSNGISHQTTTVIADDVIFLSSGRGSADSAEENEVIKEMI